MDRQHSLVILPGAFRAAQHARSATILDRMRHDGCGGRAGKAEMLTGIEGTSSRPVRQIVTGGLTGAATVVEGR